MGENSISFAKNARELPPSLLIAPAKYPQEQPAPKVTQAHINDIIQWLEHDGSSCDGQENREKGLPYPSPFADIGTRDRSNEGSSSATPCSQNNGGYFEWNESVPKIDGNTRSNNRVKRALQRNQVHTRTPSHQQQRRGRLPNLRINSIRISTRTRQPTTPVQASIQESSTTTVGANPENARWTDPPCTWAWPETT